MVNYDEEEFLSWCNKCGEPGHIRAFCTARVFCSFCKMRSHSNKACWNQRGNKQVEPFSSSRQTTPIQNSVDHGQVQNFREQQSKQTVASTDQVETSIQPQEGNPVSVNIQGNRITIKKQYASTSSLSSDVKQRPNK